MKGIGLYYTPGVYFLLCVGRAMSHGEGGRFLDWVRAGLMEGRVNHQSSDITAIRRMSARVNTFVQLMGATNGM